MSECDCASWYNNNVMCLALSGSVLEKLERCTEGQEIPRIIQGAAEKPDGLQYNGT
jgi:hypothetical protein